MAFNNNDSKDAISKILSHALDILFVKNPKNTSLGVLFGVILRTLSEIIFYFFGMTIRISYAFFIALGAFAFNVPSLFRKHEINESLETMMHYIEEGQKRGNFTPQEKREQWKRFINAVNEQTQIGEEKESSELLSEKSSLF